MQLQRDISLDNIKFNLDKSFVCYKDILKNHGNLCLDDANVFPAACVFRGPHVTLQVYDLCNKCDDLVGRETTQRLGSPSQACD